MTGRRPRLRRADAARAVLDRADARELVAAHAGPLPHDARAWLAGLCRLEGVPFDAIVPDSRMLAQESIRFFFVDRNWIDAAVDGALSVAGLGAAENALLALLRPVARAATDPPPAGAWSGFLLRSAAVGDWPGLTVTASDAQGEPLRLLRLERVAPAVLLGMVDGVAARFEIAKPSQALHFGIEDGDVVNVRWISGAEAGAELEPVVTAPVTYRDDPHGRRVVRVTDLAAAVATRLAAAYPPGQAPPVDPGAFSVQLVAGAERQSFGPPAPAAAGGAS